MFLVELLVFPHEDKSKNERHNRGEEHERGANTHAFDIPRGIIRLEDVGT